jgi:nucleotide-binding universal stress UspA family protein
MPIVETRVEVSLQTILLATDFSPNAETAKRYAEALARRYHALVRIMHVIDLSAASTAKDPGMCLEAFQQFGQASLNQIEKEFAAKDVRVEAMLCESPDPTETILGAAQDDRIDLLVIGTRGHQGIAKLVLGSSAEELIHRARCPVLVVGPNVPAPAETLLFRSIVYATDFSPEAAKALVFALSFAQECGAHLYLCHVLPEETADTGSELHCRFKEALNRLIPDIAREYCEPECIVEHGVAADSIRLLAQRVEADLIVLGTRTNSRWYENFRDGVAFKVICGSNCPVLTIRG